MLCFIGMESSGSDTPRTRDLKDIRKKRLAYFDSKLRNGDINNKDGESSQSTDTLTKNTYKQRIDKASPRSKTLYRPEEISTEKRHVGNPVNWSNPHENASKLREYAAKIQGKSTSSSVTRKSTDCSTASKFEDNNGLQDNYDTFSNVTEVTDTDVLLSQHFADQPLSVFQKSKSVIPSLNISKSSPRRDQVKDGRGHIEGTGDSLQLTTHRTDDSRLPALLCSKDSEFEVGADRNIAQGLYESTESSLFAQRHARMTPLSKDFVAASQDTVMSLDVGQSMEHAVVTSGEISKARYDLADKVQADTLAASLQYDEIIQAYSEFPPHVSPSSIQLSRQKTQPKASSCLQNDSLQDDHGLKGLNNGELAPRNQTTNEVIPNMVETFDFEFTQRNSSPSSAQRTKKADSPRSSAIGSLNFANLSMVLGEDKLRRLLQNLEESEDFENEEQEVGQGGVTLDTNAIENVNIWSSIDSSTTNGETTSRRVLDSAIHYDTTREYPNVKPDLPPLLTSDSQQFEDSWSRHRPVNEGSKTSTKINSNNDPESILSTAESLQNSKMKGVASVDLRKQSQFIDDSNFEDLSDSKDINDLSQSGQFPKVPLLQSKTSFVIDEDEDLGLETHRPSSSPTKELLYANLKQSYDYHAVDYHTNPSRTDSVSMETADVSNVTYCFSVDQIYAQAKSMNYDTKSDGSAVSPPPPLCDVNKKDVEKSRTSDDYAVRTSVMPSESKLSPNAHMQAVKSSESKLSPRVHMQGNIKGENGSKSIKKYATPIEFQKQISTAKSSNFEATGKPPIGRTTKKSKSVDIARNSRLSNGRLSPEDHVEGNNVNKTSNKGVDRVEKGQGDADRVVKETYSPHLRSSDAEAPASNGDTSAGRVSMPPSVQRYFQSLEIVADSIATSSVNFEPIPEPVIEETPRSEENDWLVKGHVVKSESVVRESHLKKGEKQAHSRTKQGQVLNDSQAKGPKHHSNQSKETPIGVKLGQEPLQDEDELYHTVQAALADIDPANPGAMENKLRDLGIDFEFLRASQNSDNLQTSSVGDVAKSGSFKRGVGAPFQQLPVIGKTQRVSENDNENSSVRHPKTPPVEAIKEKGKSARVCPECAEVNPITADLCSECGFDIQNIKPVPVHSSKSPRVSVVQKRKSKNKQIEDSAKRAGKSGLDETLQSQLTLNLSSTDSTLTNITKTEASLASKLKSSKVPSRDNAGVSVDSSISLDYSENSYQARKSIPRDLQAQLSINVRDSTDSSVKTDNGKDKSVKKINNKAVQDIRITDDGTSQDSMSVQNQLENLNNWAPDNEQRPWLSRVNRAPDEDDKPVGREEPHDSVDEEAQTEPTQLITQPNEEEGYLQFLQRLRQDPRLRTRPHAGQGYMPQPGTSQGRPRSAGSRKQFADVESKVRASWDKEPASRHWEKSNLAWTSYNSRELLKPPGTGVTSQSVQMRPRSAGRSREGPMRPQSAGRVREETHNTASRPSSAGKTRNTANVSLRQRPKSAEYGRRSAPLHRECAAPAPPAPDILFDSHHSQRASLPILSVHPVKSKENKLSKSQDSRLANYKKFLSLAQGYTGKLYDIDEMSEQSGQSRMQALAEAIQMSPRVRRGEASLLLCLPDEILLHILHLLQHRDLAACMQACSHLHRVASDNTLWRRIVLRKRQHVNDAWLREIGARQPRSLALIQCHGTGVTNAGLRELFRQCADSLEELNFTGCSRGQLTGDNLLLHTASRCQNITALDASWCNVQDNGIMALAETSNRLSALSVSGCQQLSDEAVIALVNKHGIYLQTLELFGCFNITSRAVASIATHCKSLTTLNLGQCWKLTDTCIANLAPSLQKVEHLDLRGCKQITDLTVHHVVRHCPRLRTLALANCLALSDTSLAEIATYCPHIQSLDLCGCKLVSNQGVRALSSCQRLQYLDLSSTAVTGKGVATVANYCSEELEVFKINYCKQISMQCLHKLVTHARRLQKLFIYGVRGLGPLGDLRAISSTLLIETDQARSNPLNP